MLHFFRSRVRSFQPALSGWWYVLRTRQNAWVHAVVSVGVFLLGWWLRLEARDWALIVLTVALVWLAEFVNTAFEAIVDLTSPQDHPLAKVGKDIGAAAVLIAALIAAVIGLIVFGPPLLARLTGP